ncbi:uncharacterized protein LOC123008293 [Tribolium madens]|uniref:uncharacterized protein LOC123008293 n=1 Tax=Tribolium madens TaxID=41895 RepID=UPI001CF755C4|nr:uncharacterized protein LOC123008293 [Tribolium madens]
MDLAKENDIGWMEDNSSQSTSIPEIIEESNEIGTVVIFVISAILTITLLFVVAIFIDCRQQKLINLQQQRKPKKVLKIKIPKLGMGRAIREDEDTFADKMQEPEPSSSHVIV